MPTSHANKQNDTSMTQYVGWTERPGDTDNCPQKTKIKTEKHSNKKGI